jgi:hypothetical protein
MHAFWHAHAVTCNLTLENSVPVDGVSNNFQEFPMNFHLTYIPHTFRIHSAYIPHTFPALRSTLKLYVR